MEKENYNVITKENGKITYSFDPEAADPIPHPDNPKLSRSLLRSKGLNVTASDVWREDIKSDFGNIDYYAYGYVTASSRHYTRAEMWYKGKIDAEGWNTWDYGKVSTHSTFGFNPGTSKIFYGN